MHRAGLAALWKVLQGGGSRIIQVLGTLVLAGLLLPEEFGIIAVCLVALGAVSMATETGTGAALLQLERPDETHLDTAWTIGIIRGVCSFVLLFALAPAFASLFDQPRAEGVIRLMALRPLLESLGSNRGVLQLRAMQTARLSGAALLVSAVEALVALMFATTLGVWALAWGAVAAGAGGALISYAVAPMWPRFSLDRRATATLVQFGKWLSAAGLSFVIGTLALRLALSRNVGAAELGIYFLAAKIAHVPYLLVLESVPGVATALFSRVRDDARKTSVSIRHAFVALAAMVLPVMALLFALAPGIVQLLPGDDWHSAAPVMMVLSISACAAVHGVLLGAWFRSRGQTRSVATMDLTQTLVLAALVYPMVRAFGMTGAAIAYAVAVGAGQLAGTVLARRVAEYRAAAFGEPLLGCALAAASAGIAAYVVSSVVPGAVGIVAGGGAGVVVAAGLMLGIDARLNLGIRGAFAAFAPARRNSAAMAAGFTKGAAGAGITRLS